MQRGAGMAATQLCLPTCLHFLGLNRNPVITAVHSKQLALRVVAV
jgi:hypothetical protein